MEKVLLYRRGGLGDTLLTFPLAEILKKRGCEVHFVGNKDYLELAHLCGWADKIYSSEFFSNLYQEAFDKRILISQEGHIKPFPEKRVSLPLYYLESLGLPPYYSLRLPLFEEEKRDESLAVLHPGSGSPKKNPPLELFERIERYLTKLKYKVIYLAGEAETHLLFQKKNLFHSLNIIDIARFLKRATLYVGNDSGISHLASYLGVKSFLFYGPTDEVIFSPLGEDFKLLYLNLSCRPCFPDICNERPCLDPERLFEKFKETFAG